ncbi:uncharacterized protein MONBRDRAFT_18392 [Monosiga brevicollis MX1]|uniref:V-SNARE coiled-coil homology domain-containing protein n=1 Tax=Monosiga brevicollis TaxID=81824 RepID=A9UVG6_MONBE|nr:uncharacterized protein MONBRDRAFT_18392 [Monosiga brevicollis MX1]EDQ90396.1 predicted protein [Monosiga brevicollis MX1]|eukprot:XP_001744447.1 hypothetical protein [Monosiga brevicollis MX1]
MPAHYLAVAFQGSILAEFTESQGNFVTIVTTFIANLGAQPGKRVYRSDEGAVRHLYCVLEQDQVQFVCFAEAGTPHAAIFDGLERVAARFAATFANQRTRPAYSLNNELEPLLRRELGHINAARSDTDALQSTRAQVDEVRGILVQNIDKVLQRGEALDALVDKAEELEFNADRFRHNATRLKRQMWWKNIKWQIVLFLVFVVVIIAILGIAGVFKKKKHSGSKDTTTTTTTTTSAP